MDKITYLKYKQERIANPITYQKEDFCYRCVRLSRNCLCSLIMPFETKIHFVILMHPKEAKKEKIGTGRISNLSLANSQIITGVDFSNDAQVNSLILDQANFCCILYPGKNAISISDDNLSSIIYPTEQEKKRLVVFVIDGTWPCSKKMMRKSKNIRGLTRLSFSTSRTSIFEIKEQPAAFCLSTLESLHFFIQECNRRGLENTGNKEDQMLVVFRAMIDFQVKCSLDPALASYKKQKRGYSKKEDRTQSKKWLTRNIVLAD